MKTTMLVMTILVGIVLFGVWLARPGADDTAGSNATRTAPQMVAEGVKETGAPKQTEETTPEEQAFPPTNKEVVAAEGRAATLAMNGENDEARREILRATALSGTVAPLGGFVATWYSEEGNEERYLAYLLFAQSLNAKWAIVGGLVDTLSRILGEEGTLKAQQEAAQMQQEYRAIKTSIGRTLS